MSHVDNDMRTKLFLELRSTASWMARARGFDGDEGISILGEVLVTDVDRYKPGLSSLNTFVRNCVHWRLKRLSAQGRFGTSLDAGDDEENYLTEIAMADAVANVIRLKTIEAEAALEYSQRLHDAPHILATLPAALARVARKFVEEGDVELTAGALKMSTRGVYKSLRKATRLLEERRIHQGREACQMELFGGAA